MYINPFTDFGFKYIFGNEKHKKFLINFLNGIFEGQPDHSFISDVTFIDKEKGRIRQKERGVIYDILCRCDDGRQFIVEMQNSRQDYFLRRCVYYGCRGISAQGRSGKDWNYEYDAVYTIALMQFTLPELGDDLLTDAMLYNRKTNETISDKLRFIFIQMPLFDKAADQCETDLDKWLYTLLNMESMEAMPFAFGDNLFRELQKVTSYASLTPEQQLTYDSDLKAYRDIKNQLAYALKEGMQKGRAEGIRIGIDEGRAEGRAEGRVEGRAEGRAEGEEAARRTMVRNMASNGLKAEDIASMCNLDIEIVRNYLK